MSILPLTLTPPRNRPMKAPHKRRARHEHRGAPAGDSPSQWQRKYGNARAPRDRGPDDAALEEWIAAMQAPSGPTTAATAACDCFDRGFVPEDASADREAADVISEMNALLGGRPSKKAARDDFAEMDFHDGFHLDLDPMESDTDFSEYFQVASMDDDPFFKGIGNSDSNDKFSEYLQVASMDDDPFFEGVGKREDAFAGDSMALLFRRSHDEELRPKILRKCFRCLSSHAKESKILKRRVFSRWERIAKDAKRSECELIRRAHRRQKIRRIRRIFQAWSKIGHDRSMRMQRAVEMSDWRTQSKIMTSWRRIYRREQSRRVEAQERLERVKLAQRIKKADHFYHSKLKRAFVAGWLAAAKKSKCDKVQAINSSKLKPLRSELTGRAHSAMIEDDRSAFIAQDETPTKTPQAQTTCITPERKTPEAVQNTMCLTGDKENQQPNRRGNTTSCPIKSRQSEPLRSPSTPNRFFEARQGKEEHDRKDVLPKKTALEARRKDTRTHDTDNQRPQRTSPKLLRPLKPRRSNPPLQHPTTPKMIVDMNHRKQERERRRDVLRHRYEQKAVEKKQRLEEEKHRKEQAATQVQREFLQRKAAEERRKKTASARWKQAGRLAALHYRMSLQKRMLRRWQRIFRIRSFNERKARIAWSDATYEKCWRRWKSFTEEEQGRRRERMRKHRQLAHDFNERRLLATAFAAVEEHCRHALSLVEAAQRRGAAARRASVFTGWCRAATEARRERCAKEQRAAQNGERLLLRKAMQRWQSSVDICREEREMHLLIEAKWEQVNEWLEE